MIEWEKQLSDRTTETITGGSESDLTIATDKYIKEYVIIAVEGFTAVCTHTSTLIANYLARIQKAKVATWEGENRPCFLFGNINEKGKIIGNLILNMKTFSSIKKRGLLQIGLTPNYKSTHS